MRESASMTNARSSCAIFSSSESVPGPSHCALATPATSPTPAGRIGGGRLASVTTSPSVTTAARSMAFFSSRMLPGQSYDISAAIASEDARLIVRPRRLLASARKWSTSPWISSRRSRSAGTLRVITLRRKYRSSRKEPSRTLRRRSLFVEAMMRTSTRTVVVPPTRSTSRLCRTRRILAWVASVMSPISSRSSVPPSASSNLPGLRCCAPVNAPRS